MGMPFMSELPYGVFESQKELDDAARIFINTKDALYGSIIKQYTQRTKITEANCKGLTKLIGEYGLIATTKIAKSTFIGHYYGDEYVEQEFSQKYDWSQFEEQTDHPFHKKWAYLMTADYADSDDKLKFDDLLNATLAIDAWHSYDHTKYANIEYDEAPLTEQQVARKQNHEPMINDARRILNNEKLPAPDRMRKNVEFVYCAIDGVPKTLILVTRDIEVNEQLFVYY